MSETLRPDLTALPDRIKRLPVLRGYPVPWFVARTPEGYDFRFADGQKFAAAVMADLCWVCGERLGTKLCFVVGPMCAVNRTTAEPACHYECAKWSVENCPFLNRSKMVRRENDIPETVTEPAGDMIKRNPGCSLIWVTRTYSLFDDGSGRGKMLIELGQPDRIEAFADGKPTDLATVLHSIETGEWFLRDACEMEVTPARVQAAHVALTEGLAATKDMLAVMLTK